MMAEKLIRVHEKNVLLKNKSNGDNFLEEKEQEEMEKEKEEENEKLKI